MIVIGNPLFDLSDDGPRAAGMAVAVARAAREAGAPVEIVGRVGEDAAGEAVLIDIASAGIGHAAVLRDAGHPTAPAPLATETSLFDDPDEGAEEGEHASRDVAMAALDAEDIELALRYLPEYRVVVVVDALSDSGLGAAAAAAKWAGAALVVVVADGSAVPSSLDPAATVFEAPAEDDGAFARLVGGYAAALDRGDDPAEAFAAATGGTGWARAGE
ncbi:MAG TPA: PfkB family carbohydrate kinase [Candidatus Limnocylindrales bacterium]|nr:PfkB family carbohydrate kinase [Candidatus Limnocylindrales bacterium]